MIRKITLIFLVVGALVGCQKENEPQYDYFVSSEKITNFNSTAIKGFLNSYQMPDLAAAMQYDINIYKITYKTTFQGATITASGLVTLPITQNEVSMVSIQHGTIADNASAPSEDPDGNVFFNWFASAGYIVVLPDFIGFGESSEFLHPYYNYEYTTGAVIDLMQAAREFAEEEGVNFNSDVLLAGYSEGGYATMATHKRLEEEPQPEFNFLGSAPASGGYDVKHMQEYFFGLETYDNPFFMAFVAASYLDNYDVGLTMADLFKEPYASKISSLFDGTKSGSEINAELTTIVPDLLNADFLANIDTDLKFEGIVNALNENGLVNWVPQHKMIMYHGTADITVPYDNSVVTYNKLLDNGASTDIITFIPLEGKTHYSGGQPYFLDVFNQLSKF